MNNFSRRRSTVVIRFAAALAALVAVACAEVTTEPPEEDFEVVRIELAAGSDLIEVGETTQVTATAFNAQNEDVTATTEIVWSSDPSTIVRVDQDGVATGMSEGQANVRATANEVDGTIEIDVVAATAPGT